MEKRKIIFLLSCLALCAALALAAGTGRRTGPPPSAPAPEAPVSLSQPSGLTAELRDGGVKLSWDAVPGAEGYSHHS